MDNRLHGLHIAVVGGDQREWELVKSLQDAGALVRCIGLPPPLWGHEPRRQGRDLASTLAGCEVVIAPLSGTDPSGVIRRCAPDSPPLRLDVAHLRRLAPGAILYIGKAVPTVREAASEVGVRLVETEDDDELALLNSVPTAEGAVQLAMQRLPITIHGSRSVVLGFGRCGVTLSILLQRMGSHVVVFARNAAQRARAESLGLGVAGPEDLLPVLSTADVVFNTVPARVLEREELAATRRGVVIIDIAAEPGGVDFEAAHALEREAHLALGLPGKVAPLSAGKIMSRCLLRMLSERNPAG